MIAFLFLASAALQLPSPASAVELCKHALARKAGAEIATIDVDKSDASRGRLTIQGRLTAYARMGPAPAGSARAHHVGRIDYSYVCEVRGGHVRRTRLNLFQP